jgi:hypothetical protein
MDAVDLCSLAGCKYSNLGINGFRCSGHALAGLANDLDLSEQHTCQSKEQPRCSDLPRLKVLSWNLFLDLFGLDSIFLLSITLSLLLTYL